jgi:hypothetical protein
MTSCELPHNQSLERTRGSRLVRFAGRQWWRAAQLQIRYAASVTRSDKLFAVLGRVFLAWLAVIAVYWLLGDLAEIYEKRIAVELDFGRTPDAALVQSVTALRVASHYSALLVVPAIAVAVYLGVRRIRTVSNPK